MVVILILSALMDWHPSSAPSTTRYLDIKDAADEVLNLEEWILSSRVALPDEWCLWIIGWTTVRPAPVFSKARDALVVKQGSFVDVWWHDGWWEGIIIRKKSEDNFLVYFPAEKRDSIFTQTDLRPSQEWLGIGWKQIKDRPDLVTSVLSSLCRKLDTVKSRDGGSPPSESVACDDKVQFGLDQEDTCIEKTSKNPGNNQIQACSECVDLCRKLLRRNPMERLTFEEFFNHPFLSQKQTDEMTRSMRSLRIDGFPFSERNPDRSTDESSQEDCLPFTLDDDSSGPDVRRF